MSGAPVCPNCGGVLGRVSLPFTPPWRCGRCLISWFDAQLTAEAVAAWRPRYRDFGAQTSAVTTAVAAEMRG